MDLRTDVRTATSGSMLSARPPTAQQQQMPKHWVPGCLICPSTFTDLKSIVMTSCKCIFCMRCAQNHFSRPQSPCPVCKSSCSARKWEQLPEEMRTLVTLDPAAFAEKIMRVVKWQNGHNSLVARGQQQSLLNLRKQLQMHTAQAKIRKQCAERLRGMSRELQVRRQQQQMSRGLAPPMSQQRLPSTMFSPSGASGQSQSQNCAPLTSQNLALHSRMLPPKPVLDTMRQQGRAEPELSFVQHRGRVHPYPASETEQGAGDSLVLGL
eukprot:TRINITY_DN26879_c0_g1_i1.p2 TRINITY_DN26879_c0_g1~~TRINITY_DN26879_c0_g1_i1.p2  ORF type:complete len:266 (+),score=92.78 TRINITY_DN26879_c0_g1_i1:186-983(+)